VLVKVSTQTVIKMRNLSLLHIRFICSNIFHLMKHFSTQKIYAIPALVLLVFLWLPNVVVAQSINITGSLTTFYANPGTSSPSQQYSVSATGLINDLVISTPSNQHFQVSLDNTTWSPSLSIAPNEINGMNRVVYVRYFPPADIAVSTNNGLIANASLGAESQSISVTGRNKPTIKISGTFTKVINQVTDVPSVGQQFSIEGNLLADNITVSAPDFFQVATDENGTYSNSISFAPNSGTVNSTFWVRFNPQGLLGSWTDNVSASSPSATPQSLAVEGNAIAVEPTVQTNVSLGNVDKNSIVLNFTGGNGARRLVVARMGAPATADPQDASNYLANSIFGSGALTGFNNYVVYSSNGSSVTVTGLEASTEYHFAIYEFNNGGVAGAENYLAPGASISAWTLTEPLPVTLASFTATMRDNSTVLAEWATVSELNNHRFEVERSEDGVFFQTVGTLKGAGTTNERREYRLTDPSPFGGTSYYRLRQVDYDGTTAYSKTVAVRNLNRISPQVTIFPNPTVRNLQVNLGSSSQNVRLLVNDMLGRLILDEQAPDMINEQAYSLDVSTLPAGTYQLTIVSDQGKTAQKFIKAN
jgi:trimeric autotransporter adhesin